jgi:hypothetical protein
MAQSHAARAETRKAYMERDHDPGYGAAEAPPADKDRQCP